MTRRSSFTRSFAGRSQVLIHAKREYVCVCECSCDVLAFTLYSNAVGGFMFGCLSALRLVCDIFDVNCVCARLWNIHSPQRFMCANRVCVQLCAILLQSCTRTVGWLGILTLRRGSSTRVIVTSAPRNQGTVEDDAVGVFFVGLCQIQGSQ